MAGRGQPTKPFPLQLPTESLGVQSSIWTVCSHQHPSPSVTLAVFPVVSIHVLVGPKVRAFAAAGHANASTLVPSYAPKTQR